MTKRSDPAIGGYFELELPAGKEFHDTALRLNTGRNALEYALTSMEDEIGRVYLPGYMCDALLEPLKRLGIAHESYRIDSTLAPILPAGLNESDVLVYANYFGVKQDAVDDLLDVPVRLVVDNSQAFFNSAPPEVDTFYSARKFFGVPDGAYLYSARKIDRDLERDESYDRAAHLLLRADISPERGYAEFQANEARLSGLPLRRMSLLTQRLLASIDYETARTRRDENFAYLHSRLKGSNELPIVDQNLTGPLAYPYFVRDDSLRDRLQRARIYCPTFWPEVLARDAGTFEHDLAKSLLPLPIDQRYTRADMDRILEALEV